MQSSPTEGQEESWPAPPGELIHALAQCSALIHAPHDWTESVDAMLATIGRVTRASRAWIFQVVEITETDILQDYIFEWAASPSVVQLNLTRFRLFRTSLRPPDYRALVEGRQRGEHTAFLTRDLPPGHLRDDMNSQAITAMMTVPIMLDRTWWGTLGLDDCVREVPWSSEELYFLRTCADLIGALIHRQRLDDRTRQLGRAGCLGSQRCVGLGIRSGTAVVFRCVLPPPRLSAALSEIEPARLASPHRAGASRRADGAYSPLYRWHQR